MESDAKSLARWLAEPSNIGAESIFAPISSFVTSLERVHADNLLEAAKARRHASRHASLHPSVHRCCFALHHCCCCPVPHTTATAALCHT